jgi:hypothetical protein
LIFVFLVFGLWFLTLFWRLSIVPERCTPTAILVVAFFVAERRLILAPPFKAGIERKELNLCVAERRLNIAPLLKAGIERSELNLYVAERRLNIAAAVQGGH